jgi:hypothetical protein
MADLALFVTLALGPFLGRPTSPGLGRQAEPTRQNVGTHRPHPLPALPSIPPYPFLTSSQQLSVLLNGPTNVA